MWKQICQKKVPNYMCHDIFCFAQMIQRQLEEVGEKQRDLEERGVAIEKIIRGETGTKRYIYTHRIALWLFLSLNKTKLLLMVEPCIITPWFDLQYSSKELHCESLNLFFFFLLPCLYFSDQLVKKALPCNPGLVKSLFIELMVVLTMDTVRHHCCFIFLQ